MNAFIIIALSLITLILLGCFVMLLFIWVENSPKAQAALDLLSKVHEDTQDNHGYKIKTTLTKEEEVDYKQLYEESESDVKYLESVIMHVYNMLPEGSLELPNDSDLASEKQKTIEWQIADFINDSINK